MTDVVTTGLHYPSRFSISPNQQSWLFFCLQFKLYFDRFSQTLVGGAQLFGNWHEHAIE